MNEIEIVREKLLEVQIKYHSLFEESKEFMYSSLPNGKILNVNKTGMEILGYSNKAEIIGKEITDFYYNPMDRKYFNMMIEKFGYIKDFEIVLKKKNNEKFIGIESTNTIKNRNGQTLEYIGIIKDLTVRIQNEMLLRKKNAEIKQTFEQLKTAQQKIVRQEKLASIGQLAAGIAHEINNPLGFIKSDYNTLKKYFQQIGDFLKQEKNISQESKKSLNLDFLLEDIEAIFNESAEGFERIFSIIQGLKNFAHIDSSGEKEFYDLNKAIENTLIVARNEIKYVAEIETDLNPIPMFLCIPGEINQVLLNIIINAAQAIKSMENKKLGKIKIRTYIKSNRIICSIFDSGPGIPQKELNKIFDPFFTTKEVGSGTGLGLSISYEIIKKHNGHIHVQSKVDKGTCFFISFPIKESGE